jgi:xylan 1,4-beta-xylosidase
MSYWTFSDQFEEAGIPDKPFHGGFGLLTMQGLPKPAYFAFRFLNELGDPELECDDANVWACRNDSGAVQVLLSDYTHPQQDSPNAEFFARDWPSKEIAPVKLTVAGLAPGEYRASITRVGYRHNDVYTAYLQLGAPAGTPESPWALSEADLSKLRKSCAGNPETRTLAVKDGSALEIELPLNENDVYLINIGPQRSE